MEKFPDINKLESTDTPIEEEGLEQKVETIEFTNVSGEDFDLFMEYKKKLDQVLDVLGRSKAGEFYLDLMEFASNLEKNTDEKIRDTFLFHLISGSTVDTEIAKHIFSADLPGGEIQKYLDEKLSILK